MSDATTPNGILRAAAVNKARGRTTAAAVAAEMARRGEAACRLHEVIVAGPSALARLTAADIARIGRGIRPITAARRTT